MFDIRTSEGREALSKQIKADIFEWARVKYDDGFRWHLGASVIGHDCDRYLWLLFRWCEREYFNGQMQLLFQRGHREEEFNKEILEGLGFIVRLDDGNGKQDRVEAVGGHFGGSLDATLVVPERYPLSIPIPFFLGEFKTKGTGRGFKLLLDKGVRVGNEEHWRQMNVYAYYKQWKYGIYFSTCKNDDDRHVEVVEFDWRIGEALTAKAQNIILSQTPPPRINNRPTQEPCKTCPMVTLCFGNREPLRNCRSCENAYPVEGAEWACKAVGQIIPRDVVPVGCQAWSRIV
jgi:hypothetical protein